MDHLEYLTETIVAICVQQIRIDSVSLNLVFEEIEPDMLFDPIIDQLRDAVNSGNIVLNSNDEVEEDEVSMLANEILDVLSWDTVLSPNYTRVEAFCNLGHNRNWRDEITFVSPRPEIFGY